MNRYGGRIHDTVDAGPYGATFTVMSAEKAPRIGLQIHGAGVTVCLSITEQQAHDLGALLLLAAEDARKTERCADCKAPADDKCPSCGKLVCQVCAEREGEACCDGTVKP